MGTSQWAMLVVLRAVRIMVAWLASRPIITPVQRHLVSSQDQVLFRFRNKRGVDELFLPLSSPLELITYMPVDNTHRQQP
jgi:hypothetical protein